MIVQTNLFHEDLHGPNGEELEGFTTQRALEKHFDGVEIKTRQDILETISDRRRPLSSMNPGVKFRASLEMAKAMGFKFEFANALKWLPVFREVAVNKEAIFTDLKDISNRFKHRLKLEGLFIRPASPFKEFAGEVFSTESFQKTQSYLRQCNEDEFILCLLASRMSIKKEWRAVVVGGEVIDICQYMKDENLCVSPGCPDKVFEFAQKISENSFFANNFEYVIDVAEYNVFSSPVGWPTKLGLLEVNAFQTASFYACDLSKIYKEWKDTFKNE